jgi:signal transduction histidine kinase/ActR/RegA family two-component response regulator
MVVTLRQFGLLLAGWLAAAALAQVPAAAQAPAVVQVPALATAAPQILRVGVLAGFPPYQVWPPGGQPGGADLDLLREIALDAGLALEPVRYTDFAALENDLAAGRIDVAAAMARTRQREQGLLFSRPYAQFPLALVTRADAPSSAVIPDLAGRSIAVVSGYASEDQADRLFPLASRVVVGSVREGLQAVVSGRADTLLEALPVVADLIASEGLPGLVVARRIEAPSGRLHLAVLRSRPELAMLLSDGIERIGPARIEAMVQARSAPLPSAAAPGRFSLSDAERARLARWPAPMVGVVGREPPFVQGDAGGAPEGLSVDLLRSVLARLGVEAAGLRFLREDEVAPALAAGSVDLLLGVEEAVGYHFALRFVGPFIEYPTVIVGRPEGGAFDLEQLQGRRLALTTGSSARPLLEARYPRVTLVDCSDAADCMASIVRGAADATLTDVVTAAMLLSRQPRGDLQMIGAEPGLRRFHSIAVHSRHAEVVPLLQRALEAATASELPALKQRWLTREPREEVVRAEVLRWAPWGAAVLLVLALLWAWHSSRLRGEVARTRLAQQQAERAERAGRRFTAFMAHEVRNSLHSVIAGTELLRMAPRPQVVTALSDAAQATLRLLNNLLDRERLDAGRLVLRTEPTRLVPLIEGVVQEMTPAATQRGLSLRAQVPFGAPELQLDALRVQQVLRNLVSNAIKYSDRGAIEVRAGFTPLPEARWRLALSVADQGRGIAAADLERIFEPYAGARGESASSSGLGLPLSRDLTRLMGGELQIDSAPDRGTTATLVFDADGMAAPPAASPAARPLSVLLLEDSEVFAMLLEHDLLQRGHRVQRAAGVAQAQALLRAGSVDVVLSDLNLTDGRVHDLMAEPCERGLAQKVPVVVMTADVDDPAAHVEGLAGAAAVLVKTSDPRRMVDRLLEAVAGRT